MALTRAAETAGEAAVDAGQDAPPRRRRWSGLLPARGPQRVLAAATLVNTFGSGMFVTSSALYFTRVVGLPASHVALGLTTGGIVGLLAGLAGGQVADRWGAKRTQLGVMVLGAASTTCYLFVRSLWLFVLVTCLTAAVQSANPTSRDPLVREFGGAAPAAFRAYLQAVTNLALALGALMAGVAIQVNTREAYLSLMLGRALAFVGCALILLRLPHPARRRTQAPGGRWGALRDRPFLIATVLNGGLALHYAIPTFALPLWIVGHTHAPRWMVSALLLVNTLMVSALQVAAGRHVHTTAAAGKRMLWAGLALSAGLVLMAAADGPPTWGAVLVLLAAMIVYTAGELWHAAASMEYAFGLAAPHAQGQYSGVFAFGSGVSEALAPMVLGVLVLGWGRTGWLVLGAVLLGLGALSGPLVSRAQRHTPSTTRPVPPASPTPFPSPPSYPSHPSHPSN